MLYAEQNFIALIAEAGDNASPWDYLLFGIEAPALVSFAHDFD